MKNYSHVKVRFSILLKAKYDGNMCTWRIAYMVGYLIYFDLKCYVY